MNNLKKLWNDYGEYIANIAIALMVGALAALLTSDEMAQYMPETAPPLSPPAALFPIVWTILYILMGIAAGIIQRSGSENNSAALSIYYAQLAANFFWTIIYFGLDAKLAGFAWLLVLLGLVICTAKRFRRISKTAARLLLPYIVWLIFASYLNVATVILNT